MFVRVENFNIESKSKKGFENNAMLVVMTIESTTIMSSTPAFQPKLILMFFHMDSVENSKVLFKVGDLVPLLSSSLV
jgi:hypothetical protein